MKTVDEIITEMRREPYERFSFPYDARTLIKEIIDLRIKLEITKEALLKICCVTSCPDLVHDKHDLINIAGEALSDIESLYTKEKQKS